MIIFKFIAFEKKINQIAKKVHKQGVLRVFEA